MNVDEDIHAHDNAYQTDLLHTLDRVKRMFKTESEFSREHID